MNLADPELELIDPTPNVHSLFVHFDELFFWTKLGGRALVRWSKRMYSCAGICSYEGRGGICDIALSEPLLKLRPRKDLIETLLHEMIHAFLFITNRDRDRDGHGPNFVAHMLRINRAAGLNISIYHDFHDEVQLYLKHWWRCNGRCQTMKPYFGVVRRSSNRAPGPHDYWWANHVKTCGGIFIKIKEPEKPQKAPKKTDTKTNPITKYVNNNNDTIPNKNIVKGVNKENTVLPPPTRKKSPEIKNIVDLSRKRTNSASVVEIVRNVWANKQIPSHSGATSNAIVAKKDPNQNLRKTISVQSESPPKKIKKIDDYFRKTASSILKDVYGEEFIISQSDDGSKLKAVTVGQTSKVPALNVYVDCPSCNAKVYSNDINKHLDECLNKEIIEKLSKDSIPEISTDAKVDKIKSEDSRDVKQSNNWITKKEIKTENDDKTKLKTIVGSIQSIPPFKSKIESLITTSNENSTEICAACGQRVKMPMEPHLDKCLGFFGNSSTVPIERASKIKTEVVNDGFNPLHIKSELGTSKAAIKSEPGTSKTSIKSEPGTSKTSIKSEPGTSKTSIKSESGTSKTSIKSEPGTSKETVIQKCPCCGEITDKPMEAHLDECLGFFDNNTTIPIEGSSGIDTIVIDDDDDDIFDESQTFNATGTKSPCPCCFKMVEVAEMNDHLDVCLSISLL